jgi:histidinol-phosphate phosphatase family protein
MQPAIFLDRDGVIIENRSSYVRSWNDVEIYSQALQALARINASPYLIIIITNQSAIGRGILSLELALEINQRLLEAIREAGGRVDAVFMCPHAPEASCDCRKPRPGLLLKAADCLQIDLSQSLMIGDALSDIQAGQAAGVGKTALVRTGRGSTQAFLPVPGELQPFLIYDTLSDALKDLIQL